MENKQISSWLLEHSGNHQIFRLYIGENTIGRHSTNTFSFLYDFISRYHAIINIKDDDTTINLKCLNPFHGVFVNGTRLNGALMTLHNMDEISIGISKVPSNIQACHTVFILRRSLLRPNELIEISDDDDDDLLLMQKRTEKQPTTPDGPKTSKKAIALQYKQHMLLSSNVSNKSGAKVVALNNKQKTPPLPDVSTTSGAEVVELSNKQHMPLSTDVPTTSGGKISILKNKLHMPLLPVVKLECVVNASLQIKDVFGDPDEVILDSIKGINGYVFNNLSNGNVIINNSNNGEPLVNGNIIDISNEADESDKTKKNMGSIQKQNNIKNNTVHDNNEIIVLSDEEDNEDADEDEELLFSQSMNHDLRKEWGDSDSDCDMLRFEEEIDVSIMKPDINSIKDIISENKVHTITLPESREIEAKGNNKTRLREVSLDDCLNNIPKPNEMAGSLNKIMQRRHSVHSSCFEGIPNTMVRKSTSEIPSSSKQLKILKASDNFKTSDRKTSLNGECTRDMPQSIKSLSSSSKLLKRSHSAHSSCFVDTPNIMESISTSEIPNSPKQLEILKASNNFKTSDRNATLNGEHTSDMPQTNKNLRTPAKIVKRRHSMHSSCFEDKSVKRKMITSLGEKEVKALANNETSVLDKDCRLSDKAKVNEKSSCTLPRVAKRRHSIHYSCSEEDSTHKSASTPSADNRLKNQEPLKPSKLIPSRRQSVAACFNDKKPLLQIIDAPALPKYRGKLRGVSAVPAADRVHKKKDVKEGRKDRLKKVADVAKQDLEAEKNNTKIVENLEKVEICHVSAKVTSINRGALLAKELNQQPAKKIPKLRKRPKSNSSLSSEIQRSVSVDSCSNQLPNVDVEKLQEPEEDRPARGKRVLNKLTFAKMESAFEKQRNIDKRVSELQKQPLETIESSDSIPKAKKIIKTVRFNDEPIVHLIEKSSGAGRKVDRLKDFPAIVASTYKSRRNAMRRKYSFVDYKSSIILDILRWSNQWLEMRNANEAADNQDTILPMPNEFLSFEHYKSVILPLMKLEIQSIIKNSYKEKTKSFNVTLENVNEEMDRFKLITKGKSSDISKYDLYTVTFANDSNSEIFAYLQRIREENDYFMLEFCIDAANFTENFLLNQKTLIVRPIVDNIRVEIGALNSVYHLKNTPLFKKIIDPLNLNSPEEKEKTKITLTSTAYEGYNAFNAGQLKALLDTYSKVINDLEPNITLIDGPPGTGKSMLIANLAVQCLFGGEVRFRDRKILICSNTNTAINGITIRFKTIIEKSIEHKKIRVVRFGMKDRMCSKTQEFSVKYLIEEIKQAKINQFLNKKERDYYSRRALQLKDEVKDLRSRHFKGTFFEDEILAKEKELKQIKCEFNKHFTAYDEHVAIKQILEETDVVCTTLSSCVKLSQYIQYFDICIIDEATQCTEPWSLLPLRFGVPSLVLVGDTQQMPATVLSKKASELGLKKSMFSRIQNCLEQKGAAATDGVIHHLTTQYRMHPEICKWPNEYFYNNSLYNGTNTLKHVTDILPYCVFDLKYTRNEMISHGTITNKMEAEFITKLLSLILEHISIQSNSYVILTPYKTQIETLKNAIIRQKLPYISTNTIDAYQGLQRDVVVISNARSSGVGFLANYQRLNVALTRSRKCLILCGNFRDLEQKVPVWKDLLQDARVRNLYFAIEKPSSLDDLRTNLLPKLLVKKQ